MTNFIILLYRVINTSTEQSPYLEPNSSSARQEILRIFWDPIVHYFFHHVLPFVPILSHINPIHGIPPSLWKIHFSIIFPPTPSSYKSLRFPHHSPLYTCPLPRTRRMLCPYNFSLFDYPNGTGKSGSNYWLY